MLHLHFLLCAVQGCALHAVAGYEDGSVALWDTRQPNEPLATAKLHSEAVMCLAVGPDCTSGFSGSADKHLSAFKLNITKGQLVLTQQLSLSNSNPGIADVAIRPDGRIAASAGWDGKVRVWHARKRLPLALLRWHSQQVACVQFSADCRLLAAGGRDNHISMWSIYPPGAP
jgi:WD40 repeat protein